jgi:holo-[acyl-carrier protein] synthase
MAVLNDTQASAFVAQVPPKILVGIGIDREDCARFRDLSEPELSRLFTPLERASAREGARRAEHLAGKFAAKEAAIKALSAVAALSPLSVEILNEPSGRPYAVLPTELGARCGVLLSVTHTADTAMAFAVAFSSTQGP